MNPIAIREQLFEEHDRIRAMMALVIVAADRITWGDRSHALHDALAQLAEALRCHNEREEKLAREIDVCCGAGLANDMLAEEHSAEHRALYEALLVATTTSDARVAAAMAYAVCDRVGEHMTHEERTVLAAPIFRDDPTEVRQ